MSVARTLAGLGARVVAFGSPDAPVRASRSCSRFVALDRGGDVVGQALELLESAAGLAGAVVLPCDDDGLELVARHRPRLVELGYRPVEANDEVLLAMLDKSRTYELAREADVAAPAVRTLRSVADVDDVAGEVAFPCVLKPVHSHLYQRRAGRYGKVISVADESELRAVIGELQALGLEMLLTEVVPGGDGDFCSYYTYLDGDGAPLFHFTKRKIRQYPIHFGLITYQVTDWTPEVADAGLRLFQRIGLRGIANAEFKLDRRDGVYKLIECNLRFTAANELVRRSGIDIARLAYARVTGGPLPRVDSYRRGMRMWHPIEDVRALCDYRQAGELTVGAWAKSLLHRQHVPLFRLSDPGPTVANLRRMARKATAGAAR